MVKKIQFYSRMDWSVHSLLFWSHSAELTHTKKPARIIWKLMNAYRFHLKLLIIICSKREKIKHIQMMYVQQFPACNVCAWARWEKKETIIFSNEQIAWWFSHRCAYCLKYLDCIYRKYMRARAYTHHEWFRLWGKNEWKTRQINSSDELNDVEEKRNNAHLCRSELSNAHMRLEPHWTGAT